MKRPPYAGKSIAEFSAAPPAAGLWWISAGAQAWQRARDWISSTEQPRLTACIPPDAGAADFRWDFVAGKAALVRVGPNETEGQLAEQIASVLIAFGARMVVCASDDAPPTLHVSKGTSFSMLDDHPALYPLLEYCVRCGGL